MIEAVIVTKAIQDTDLDALIAKRITPATDPVDKKGTVLPRITYQRISTKRMQSNDGPTGLSSARVDLNLYAETYDQVQQLAEHVRRIFDGFAGEAITQGGRAVKVASTAVIDQDDQPGDHAPGDQKPTQRIRLELRVQWHEA